MSAPKRLARLLRTAGGLLALLPLSCAAPPRLSLSPGEWRFGTVTAGGVLDRELLVKNLSRRPLEVRPLSVFESLQVQPAALTLQGGETGAFRLRYDPAADSGPVERRLIIAVPDGRGGGTRLLYRVGGQVTPREDGPPPDPRLPFHYYHDPGCKGCTVLLTRLIFALQNEHGIRVRLADHDISRPEVLAAYEARLDELGVEMVEFPALILGNAVLQGAEQIGGGFQRLLLEGLGRADPPAR